MNERKVDRILAGTGSVRDRMALIVFFDLLDKRDLDLSPIEILDAAFDTANAAIKKMKGESTK